MVTSKLIVNIRSSSKIHWTNENMKQITILAVLIFRTEPFATCKYGRWSAGLNLYVAGHCYMLTV